MDISNRYRYQSDIEHVLSNTGMYLGSIEKIRQNIWIYNEEKSCIDMTELDFHPALYKIIDEPLSNCYDHYVRTRGTDKSVKTIRVELDNDQVTIYNDGKAIDIEIHPDLQIYVPEMIFGNLRTSSNYNEEDKIVGGKHGLGVKLTAIMSKLFKIQIMDTSRNVFYKQEFKDNLKIEPPVVESRRGGSDFLQITFQPDFARFGLECFPNYMAVLIKKRLFDFALLAPEVKFSFNGKVLTKRTFKNYVSTCIGTTKFAAQEEKHWKIAVAQSSSGFVQISFVNGIHTLQGGCHVEYVTNLLLAEIKETIKKRKNINVPLKILRDQIFLFVACNVVNPSFSGQIKESLVSNRFAESIIFSEEFVEKVYKYIANASCTILTAKEKIKKDRQDSRLLNESNGSKVENLRGIPELTDANWAGTKKSNECILIICEGLSAATGIISGLRSEDRNRFGVYPLRGKLFNPQDKCAEKIASNKIITDLKKVIGLENGKIYTSVDKLRYGKIVFMTDQDLDGSHIKGLGLNAFYSLWPSLLIIRDFIGYVPTPIIKITKGSKVKVFYYSKEFEEWKAKTESSNSWTVKYYKGLGTSTAAEFKEYFKNLRLIHFEADSNFSKVFKMAFSKGASDQRKEWLVNYTRSAKMKISSENRVTYSSFVNDELIHFSKYDCDRSIPSMDGLKISQRKILFTAFTDLGKKEIKVAQFCGRTAQLTHYHHGEVNLEGAIVGMAQNFVGSNNINLLSPIGQFGSRIAGGDDAANARYIFTNLETIARLIFRPEDDPILEYNEEDGHKVEPRFYLPIVPMILVNGSSGIGTGFSSRILPHDIKDIVEYIKTELLFEDGDRPELVPFFKGFKGEVKKIGGKRQFTTTGTWKYEKGRRKLIIDELPIGFWTLDFRKHLESLIDNDVIKTFTDSSTDTDVLFTIDLIREMSETEIVKTFKLCRQHSETNMYLFNFKDKLKKFETCEEIIDHYISVRAKFYEIRKKHILKTLEEEIRILRNKKQFIQDIVSRNLDIFKTKTDLEQDLDLHKFDRVDNSFSYLVNMPIGSLQAENVLKLEQLYKKLEKDLKNAQSRSIVDMWITDLEELLKHL